jgi:hypothetical protein
MDQIAYFSDGNKKAVKVSAADDEDFKKRIKQMQDHQQEQ